jgi:hypothetical protein
MRSIVLCLLLGGCAVTGADCASDAYSLGARDGRLGAGLQGTNYASRCSAQFDQPRYAEGYRAGLSARPIPLW